MKNIIPSLFLISIFLFGCNSNSQQTNNGILYPHIIDTSVVFIGNVNNNYVYAYKDYNQFENNTISFSTIVVTEDFGYIIKNPMNNKYALQGFDEIDTVNIKFDIDDDDNLYSNIWNNSLEKKWNKNYETKKLKNDEPIYPVATNYSEDMAHIFYVTGKLEEYNKNKYLFFAMQRQERYSILLDLNNNIYFAAKCDYFWEPIEQERKREIKNNDIATALIKYFNL